MVASVRRNLRHPIMALISLLPLGAIVGYFVVSRSAAQASLTSAARTAGYACAHNPAALVPPSAFGGRMVVTLHTAERSPATTAIGSAPSVPPYLWFVDINARLSEVPASFDPFDPSPIAAAHPRRVDQETTTIQAFPTARAATWFLRGFDPTAQPKSYMRAGVLRKLSQHTSYLGHPGDLMLVIRSHITGRNYPADVQFVLERGPVVATVELVGGDALTSVSQRRITTSAERAITQACPTLPTH